MLSAAPNAGAQEGDGPIRLAVQILCVAAAYAGAFVVLLELSFEIVKVCDALRGRVGAHPWGRLLRTVILCDRLLCIQVDWR